MEEANPDLDSFRAQWRAEVTARSQTDESKRHRTSVPLNARAARRPPGSSSKIEPSKDEDDEEDGSFNQVEQSKIDAGVSDDIQGFTSKIGNQEPRSALEHYEKAVERENQGSLGDSVALYRKAFRLDHRVDIAYKNKHFPPSSFAPKPSTLAKPSPQASSTQVVSHPLQGPPTQPTLNELIAGFSGLSIDPAPAEIEGSPAPPCPIANLPDEILVHILTSLAIMDVASFARTARVCKRLAFLVTTEEQIWKRVCVGSEVGFAAMHYAWQTEVEGGPLLEDLPSDEEDVVTEKTPSPHTSLATAALLRSVYLSSWRQMFRFRPRIRFNGCYISTVNYMRPGQASTNQLTWNSPVHIVTYYRYLRFFRNGTCLSLCTVNEPIEVIPYLTKDFQENKMKVKVDPSLQLPQAVMNSAHRGRWRLSSVTDNPEAELKDSEGDVFVETEGVGHKYIYRMELSLRSVGRSARNNKLAWKGYWHYNKLTDDWGEFGLRNDKAFFWSRVKSWGMGE